MNEEKTSARLRERTAAVLSRVLVVVPSSVIGCAFLTGVVLDAGPHLEVAVVGRVTRAHFRRRAGLGHLVDALAVLHGRGAACIVSSAGGMVNH